MDDRIFIRILLDQRKESMNPDYFLTIPDFNSEGNEAYLTMIKYIQYKKAILFNYKL